MIQTWQKITLAIMIPIVLIGAGIEKGVFRKTLKNLKPMVLIEGSPLYNGLPTLSSKHEKLAVLENKRFINGFSLDKKQAIWTAYRLYNDCRMPLQPRPNFRGDPRIKNSDSLNFHYKRNRFDRGHNAPNNAMTRCYGRQAQIDSFMYSNITPQYDYFNRKQWRLVEHTLFDEAQYARITNTYIVMGHIYTKESVLHKLSMQQMRGIPTPSKHWICRKQGEELGKNIKCWVFTPFYLNHNNTWKKKHWQTIPYANLMKETGLEFHWEY